MTLKKTGYIALVLLVLSMFQGCTSSRYKMQHDKAPEGLFDASAVPDAVPVWEPLSPRGNKSPYTVRGREYHILPSAQGYVETGISSWYGLKFHGELTSNGEVYNMYEMSAAHKTLPLPSYLRVTNLDNGRVAIVRVNDRGPFHEDRIIDLSYAAAKKLGFDQRGTAKVKLESLNPASAGSTEPGGDGIGKTQTPDRLSNFVQVAALSSKSKAAATKVQLEKLELPYPVFVAPSPDRDPPVYRVRVGPIDDSSVAERTRAQLQQAGIGRPIIVRRSVQAKGS